MRFRWLTASIFAALILLGAAPLAAETPPGGDEGWVELFTDDGITAWEKAIPGRDLPVYKASGVFKANIYELLAVLNDFSRHKEWMRFMEETRILWRPDDFHLIIYVLFNSPWPVWDRDTVMSVVIEMNEERREVEMRFERIDFEQMPPKEGIIRVPRGHLWARLRYLDPQRTEVEGWMDIDPAGDLPRWLVRWFSRRVPHQALQRMREQLEKTRGLYTDFVRKLDRSQRSP